MGQQQIALTSQGKSLFSLYLVDDKIQETIIAFLNLMAIFVVIAVGHDRLEGGILVL
jgi:hypothetical protein